MNKVTGVDELEIRCINSKLKLKCIDETVFCSNIKYTRNGNYVRGWIDCKCKHSVLHLIFEYIKSRFIDIENEHFNNFELVEAVGIKATIDSPTIASCKIQFLGKFK